MAKRLAVMLCAVVMLAHGPAWSENRRWSAWGDALLNVHEVSVQELMARADFFDGQPVRVIVVAGFDFGLEGRSGLYATKADQMHSTYAYVGIGGLGPLAASAKPHAQLLNGKFILIEGTFRALKRQRIGRSTRTEICVRGCGAPGFIEDVNRIEEWPPSG